MISFHLLINGDELKIDFVWKYARLIRVEKFSSCINSTYFPAKPQVRHASFNDTVRLQFCTDILRPITAIALCFRIQSLPPTGERGSVFADVQEIANNAVNGWEIWAKVLVDNITFGNVNMVSTATITRVLEKCKKKTKNDLLQFVK